MSRFAALCWKELLVLSRDRHGLLVLFLVPTLFILIMSLALRDAFSVAGQGSISLRLIDQDGAPLARQFGELLAGTPAFHVVDGDATVSVTILHGFSEMLATRLDFADDFRRGEAEPPLLRIAYQATTPAQVKAGLGLAVRECLLSVQTQYLLETVQGYPPQRIAALRYLNDPRRLPVTEGFTGIDGRPAQVPSSVQQSTPAWLIFAMFFSVIPLATTFVTERGEGTWLRLRALHLSPLALFASKAVPYYLVNLLQMGVMLAVGVWLVPALGGDHLAPGHSPFGLWLIGSATSVAALGMALLVAIHVRTTTQATVAGGAASLIFAALGGIMVPKLVMPPAMQLAARASPMSWSLEGFWDILLRGGSWTDVLDSCAALLAFGGGCVVLAALRFRHQQTR